MAAATAAPQLLAGDRATMAPECRGLSAVAIIPIG